MFAMAAVAMTFASCGNKTEGEVATEDSLSIDTIATIDAEQDPVEALSAAVETGDATKISELINQASQKLQGLTGDEAKEYAFQLQKFVEENKAKLEEVAVSTTTLSDLVNAVTNVPETATEVATAAKEAVKADAQKVADDAKAAAQQKAEEVKAAAEKKANEAVNAAAQKASNAAANAIDKAAADAKKSLGL